MSKRKLIIDDKEYEYRVGQVFVLIRSDGRKVACPSLSELTGENWNGIERDQWNKVFHVTPNQVADYIRGL